MRTNLSGGLTARIAANTLILEFGKASASRFAAPSDVAPLVMTSSTSKISAGSDNTVFTASVSKWSCAFGLFSAKLVDALGSGLVLIKHSLSLPNLFCANAFANL